MPRNRADRAPRAADLRALLETRADTLTAIRAFFDRRGVVEVETPALLTTATSDPALSSIGCRNGALDGDRYLRTSPEHAMKRLLIDGSGDIFELARVFRDEELGRWHVPEFTLLEWYRIGFDERRLMDEVHELLGTVLSSPAPERLDLRYRDAFESALGVDPLRFDGAARRRLEAALAARGIDVPEPLADDALLDLALSAAIVPDWPDDTAVFLFDYPATQAAEAALKPTSPPVAARFELFVNGLELANGFRELTDAAEQRRRFEADLARRRERGLPEPAIDDQFLEALDRGLPDCAGVALGVDRLIAIRCAARSLSDVVP